MLDALVTLRAVEDIAKIVGGKLAVEPIAGVRPETVRIKLYARAPQSDCTLMLWDDFGRNPELLKPQSIHRGASFLELEWVLDNYSVVDLKARTVTWSVRLASPRADSFEVHVDVFQGPDPAPGGRFFYAGPLEASEIEERTGRFHFTLESQPSQAV